VPAAPGSSVVLMATAFRFERCALAPPLAPPRQLPLSVQIVPPASGKLMLRLAVGTVKPTVVVNEPLLAVMVLAVVPCRVND